MLKTGREHLEGLRDGRTCLYRRREGRRCHDSSGLCRSGADRRRHVRRQAGAGESRYLFLRGGRRALFDLVSAREIEGRSAQAPEMPQGHRRHDLRHVRPLAGPCFRLRHRHVDPAVRLRYRGLEVRRQPGRLLRALPQERRLRDLCRATAPGRAQPGILHAPEPAGADALGNRRARRRHRDQRHEDAGDQRGLLRRHLDRQPAAARAQPGQAGGNLRRAGGRAGADPVVAPAAQPQHLQRVRRPARLALRRNRFHGDVRKRLRAVGEGVRHGRRHQGAQHLYRDAGALLRQPPVQRALLVEDGADRRPVLEGGPGDRRDRGAGGPRGAGPDGGAGGHPLRHDPRPDRGRGSTGRTAMSPSTGA